MIKILSSISLLLLVFCLPLLSQSNQLVLQDTFPEYPFIEYGKNKIEEAENLKAVFQQLRKIEKGQSGQLRIAHIGDSHIQADLFSGMLRALLQHRFGSAGRGLTFFYKEAGTHSPLDLKTSSTNKWESRRRIFQRGAPPIGISGMSIQTNASEFQIQLYQKDIYGIPYPFNKLTLFHNATGNYEYTVDYQALDGLTRMPPMSPEWSRYKVKAGETLSELAIRFKCSVQQLRQWNKLSGSLLFAGQELQIQQAYGQEATKPVEKPTFASNGDPFSSGLLLPDLTNALSLKGQKKSGSGAATLYGLLLENTYASGILYNMMGVNGATYYHFNHAEHFKAQLAILKPDLIIITLGTNEAIQSKFYPDQVQREIHGFLKDVRNQHPEVGILLMTNPDVLVKKRAPSPYSERVQQMIIEAAQEYGAAYWDLYSIMGKEGSIRNWRAEELAYVDFIHFTKKGYILQAHLLFEALMKAYVASY